MQSLSRKFIDEWHFLIENNPDFNFSGLQVQPVIAAGSSDMKHVRNRVRICLNVVFIHFSNWFFHFQFNISAIGFAPMINTVSRAHDHNEYLNADVYLNGIEVYKKVIPNIANV